MKLQILGGVAVAALLAVSGAKTGFAQAENCMEYMPVVQAKFDQASDEMKAKAKAHMDEALKAQSENNEEVCLEKLHMADQELGGQ